MTSARSFMPDRVGMNGVSGRAVLNGINTVVIPCPEVTALSLINFWIDTANGTIGAVLPAGRTPGVSFSVTSVLLNTSTIGWLVFEPS